MKDNEKEDNKFTWGDPVLVKKNAPQIFHPGEFASICGIDKIVMEKEANEFFCKIGEWIYIVEFEDGSSIEVPECYLEKYKE
ncbi:MAG: hypothetical protein K1060chlam5_01004 [Candidatus Anoxychlamydiales bacterium]|nr:hypothetical protein [Candidatus Anoxychlamydiales bacterium]